MEGLPETLESRVPFLGVGVKDRIGPMGTGGTSSMTLRGPREPAVEGRRVEFAVDGREAELATLLLVSVRRWPARGVGNSSSGGGPGAGGCIFGVALESARGRVLDALDLAFFFRGNGGNAQSRFVSSGDGGSASRGEV